jgi:hypothetical protein
VDVGDVGREDVESSVGQRKGTLSAGQFISKFDFAGLKLFALHLMKWQNMTHLTNVSNIGGDDFWAEPG